MELLDQIVRLVRRVMRLIARGLNTLSGGRMSPNLVTITALVLHLPVAWWIAQGHFLYATFGLIAFGLFDALDGELARLQKQDSSAGMVLDATTDRIKEVMLYMGIASYYSTHDGVFGTATSWLIILALGASQVVSYVKAKGETAVKDRGLSPNEINRLFADGLFRFEVRIAIIIAGLASGYLDRAVLLIAVGASLTAAGRLWRIYFKLSRVGRV